MIWSERQRTSIWSAPLGVDKLSDWISPSWLGFRKMEAMTKHWSHSVAFKTQGVLYGQSDRHSAVSSVRLERSHSARGYPKRTSAFGSGESIPSDCTGRRAVGARRR
jgi:hypothetical protein